MAASIYDEALRRLLAHEGGYSNHPSDPGGPTNFGITLADYRRYIKPDATAADLRTMSVDQAKAIYRKRYWDAQRCDELPAGVDYSIFDYGVNSGVGRSGKVLRRVVGLPADTSAVTDQVLAYARVRDPKVLVAAICDERLAFLQSLKTWPVFGRGWGTRVAEVRAVSLALAGKAQGVTPSPAPPAGCWHAAVARAHERDPRALRVSGHGRQSRYRRNGARPAAATSPAPTSTTRCPGARSRSTTAWSLPGFPATTACGRSTSRATAPVSKARRWARSPRRTRDGGGHVFLVVGRTKDGRLVGRGGNQRDMVCDEVFDPSVDHRLHLAEGLSAARTARLRRSADGRACAQGEARTRAAAADQARAARKRCRAAAQCRQGHHHQGRAGRRRCRRRRLLGLDRRASVGDAPASRSSAPARSAAPSTRSTAGMQAPPGSADAEPRPRCSLKQGVDDADVHPRRPRRFVAVYWFWIRPILKSRPAFRELYEQEESFFAAVREKFKGIKQKLSSAIVIAASASR